MLTLARISTLRRARRERRCSPRSSNQQRRDRLFVSRCVGDAVGGGRYRSTDEPGDHHQGDEVGEGGIWWVASIDAAPSQPGTAAGFADACFALSGIIAPAAMGFIVGSTGTYNGGFIVMTVLCLIGAAAMLFFTEEPQRPASGTESEGALAPAE